VTDEAPVPVQTDRWGRPIPTRIQDKTGRDIKPGDFLVVGHAAGRTSTLKFLKVAGVNIPQQSIRALETLKWRRDFNYQRIPPDPTQKPRGSDYTHLTYPSRMLIVDRHVIPKEVAAVLDRAELNEPITPLLCAGCKIVQVQDEQAREVGSPLYFRFGDQTRVFCGTCGQIVFGEIDGMMPSTQ